MKLITAAQPDDPVFNPFFPRVGCGICGQNVQALPADNEIVSAEQLLELMGRWSHDHAATHTDEEHQEHDAARLKD